MAIPAKKDITPPPQTIEDVLIKGDLSQLTTQQRTEYYLRVCQSIGLNPMTQPFEFIMLNGKLRLYALRACADQLRKINGISIEIVSRDFEDGLLSVHVRAKEGRTDRLDEDVGVVAMPDSLKGEARANAILKAVTKAKRRVTLSISGLGYLDETEIEDIPASAKKTVTAPVELKPKTVDVPHDPKTGEIKPPHSLDVPKTDGGEDDWIGYGQQFLAAIKCAKNKSEIDEWLDLNNQTLTGMETVAPKIYKRLMSAIGKQ